MKIALVAPPYPLEEAPSPPLGLCYVAAACEAAGARVMLLDYIVSRYTPQKLKDALDAFQPDVVGATSVTMNFPDAIGIIRDTKAHNPGIITLMGGPHVSFDVENTLDRHPELDLIVIGESEQTLQELIPTLLDRRSWASIPGIAYRSGGSVTRTPPRPLIADLDHLPLPARHLLPMSRYQALGFPVSIITSRGCPNRCIFCLGRRMVGRTPRFRNPGPVVDEIAGILSHGITRINIADDLFTADKRRVKAVCSEIIRRGVRFDWSAFARVNTVDLETLQVMRRAGCDSISFGIESGSPEMLKRVKKGITLAQARQAVRWGKQAGLRLHASFMVGLPGESPETLEQTRRFAEALDIEYGFHFLAPFPGTTVREQVDRYDLEILTDDWRRYDANQAIVRTSSLSPERMDRFVADIYRRHKETSDPMEARYLQGTCTEQEFLLFEGFYRMRLVYRMLVEDIIDRAPLPAVAEAPDPIAALAACIRRHTRMDAGLVDRTIKSLVAAGYLRHAPSADGMRWSWADDTCGILPQSN